MNNFLDHMIFVCFSGVAIIAIFMLIAGIFNAIDHFTKGKFSDTLINFLSDPDDE